MKRALLLLLACLACCGIESSWSITTPQALPRLLDLVLLAPVGPPGWCAWQTYGGRSRWLAPAGAHHQRYADGCGAAALQALLLESHGVRWHQSLLYALTRQPQGGTSLARLQSVAQQLGFACRVEALDLDAGSGPMAVPALVHLRCRHFVVLLAMEGGRAVVVDPACGRLVVAASALRDAASGLALRCTSSASSNRPGGKTS